MSEDKRKIVIPFTLEQFKDAIERVKAEYDAGNLDLVGLFEIETLEYYYQKANGYDEKETPIKVQVIDEPHLGYIYYCPSCGATLMVDRHKHPKHLFNFCGKCRQKLDWSKE